MENLEPKTRFEYFLNKIAENGGNSGSGSDQSTFDMSKIVLDISTLEPVTINGAEVPSIIAGLNGGYITPIPNPFIYDFINNDIPPIAKLEESNEESGFEVTTTFFSCIYGGEANADGLNQYPEGDVPVLLEDSLIYVISLFPPEAAEPYNIALFPPTAQFGLKEISLE